MRMLQLTQRQLPDGATEIEVDGELDLSVADRLQIAIDEAGTGPGSTLIDLRYCTFIDSTGIAVILRAHRAREKEGGRLVVHSPSSSVQRVFTLTGLTDSALVVPDPSEASAATEA
jgi:anti-anti-sigma factor